MEAGLYQSCDHHSCLQREDGRRVNWSNVRRTYIYTAQHLCTVHMLLYSVVLVIVLLTFTLHMKAGFPFPWCYRSLLSMYFRLTVIAACLTQSTGTANQILVFGCIQYPSVLNATFCNYAYTNILLLAYQHTLQFFCYANIYCFHTLHNLVEGVRSIMG